MTCQPIKKATVAAILSTFLVLAVPVMAADAEAPVRSESTISWSFTGFLTWLGDQAQERLANLFGSDASDRSGEPREKVEAQQRSCASPEANGCKD